MTRFLPLGSLFLLSFPALAQQPDTLASRRVGVAVSPVDSLTSIRPQAELNGFIDSVPGLKIEHSSRIVPFLPLQEQLRQVAGVQAAPYSGAPGALVAVRIRGAASLAGNAQPLYVVDGVPVYQNMGEQETSSGSTLAGLQPARVYGLNPLLNLPAEDIESVTVLRGAFETARYGAQGQNGVISIKTKLGSRSQAPQVRYSGYGGVQQVRRRQELLTAREYAEFQNEAARNDQRSEPFSAAEVAALGQGTDWQREVLRTAATQEHHLSVAGSLPNTRYYAGADYLRQNGIVENSRLRRYALRANVQQQLLPRLTLDARVGASQAEAQLPDESLALNMLTADPTRPARLPNGELNNSGRQWGNPLRQALLQTREPRQRQLLGGLTLRQGIGQYITASALGHWERNMLFRRSFDPSINSTFDLERRRADDRQYRQRTYQIALDVNRTLAERHALTARLELRQQDMQQYDSTDARITGRLGQGVEISVIQTAWQLQTATLQAGYTYAGRYELQASLRRDGSSAFGADERWQWSPGAQLTWHAGQEAFLRDNATVSQLDAWVGMGRTYNAGNYYGQNFFTTVLYQPGQGGPNGTAIRTTPLLETTTQHDAGLRAGFWQNRLLVQAGAYQRRTSLEAMPLLTPINQPTRTDIGQVQSRGLELTLTSEWLRGPRWQASSTLALAAQQSKYTSQDVRYINGFQAAFDGGSLATFRGPRYLGLDASGQPRYADLNGNGVSSTEDYENLGSGLPSRLLGFTQQLRYQRLSVQLQADGAFGHQVHDAASIYLDNPGGYLGNGRRRLLQRWTPTNTATDVPAAGAELAFNSSYFLQSGNHVRLSSLLVSYRVWEQQARSVSVWLGGHNLLVLSNYRGYDPGVSSGGANANQAGLDASAYPTARTVLLGVRGEF